MLNKTATIMSDSPADGSPARGATGEFVRARQVRTSLAHLLDGLEQSVGELPLHPQLVGSGPSNAISAPGLYAVHKTSGRTVYRMVDSGLPFDMSNPRLASYLAGACPDRAFLVLDPRVEECYGADCRRYFRAHHLEHVVLKLPQRSNNERNKGVKAWNELLINLMNHRPTRRDLLLAIGGGVTHDVVGFTAATLRRGMPLLGNPHDSRCAD